MPAPPAVPDAAGKPSTPAAMAPWGRGQREPMLGRLSSAGQKKYARAARRARCSRKAIHPGGYGAMGRGGKGNPCWGAYLQQGRRNMPAPPAVPDAAGKPSTPAAMAPWGAGAKGTHAGALIFSRAEETCPCRPPRLMWPESHPPRRLWNHGARGQRGSLLERLSSAGQKKYVRAARRARCSRKAIHPGGYGAMGRGGKGNPCWGAYLQQGRRNASAPPTASGAKDMGGNAREHKYARCPCPQRKGRRGRWKALAPPHRRVWLWRGARRGCRKRPHGTHVPQAMAKRLPLCCVFPTGAPPNTA